MTNETQATEIQDVEVPFDVPTGFRLLSDAEMEKFAAQIVEDHREKWEVQEIVDAAVAAGEINELMRNEFLWEFKQNGRTLRGLTAAMIAHLATAEGITEEIDRRVYEGEGDYHEFEVVVSIADPRHPDGKLYRSGFSEEPKVVNGRYDKFGKIKAYTKAFSRACKKLLPQDLMIAAIYKLARLVPVDWTPRQALPEQHQQRALPPTQENGNHTDADSGRETARKAMYAQYNERKAELEKRWGITEEILKAGILKRYNVDSRAGLTEAQYVEVRKVRKALTGKFAKWVLDLTKKKGESDTSTEEEASDTPTEADPRF